MTAQIIRPREQAHIDHVQNFIKHLFDANITDGVTMATFIINCLHYYSKDIQTVTKEELDGKGLPVMGVIWLQIARRVQMELKGFTH